VARGKGTAGGEAARGCAGQIKAQGKTRIADGGAETNAEDYDTALDDLRIIFETNGSTLKDVGVQSRDELDSGDHLANEIVVVR
jgi:hypothetical protein